MSINGEKLKCIKSGSLRLFCIKAQISWFSPSAFSLPSPQTILSSEGLTFASHMEEMVSARIHFWRQSYSIALQGDCSWNLSGLPLLTHPTLTMAGSVILSDLVTSSSYSQLSLATGKLLQKALLASFYSLVTGNWSFWPVIFCGNVL